VYREEIQNLHTSPNIVWAVNSKRIKREEHVARMRGSREKQLARPSYRGWFRRKDQYFVTWYIRLWWEKNSYVQF